MVFQKFTHFILLLKTTLTFYHSEEVNELWFNYLFRSLWGHKGIKICAKKGNFSKRCGFNALLKKKPEKLSLSQGLWHYVHTAGKQLLCLYFVQ